MERAGARDARRLRGLPRLSSDPARPRLHALCEIIVAVAFGEIPRHEMAWATRKAGIAAAAAQKRGFAELQTWIDRSLGPVVRACRELLSCLNQPLQDLGVDEVLERAHSVSRDDAFRPLAGHCADQICQTLGYPIGSWGLSQKIFQTNFDLHSQIKWINQQVVLCRLTQSKLLSELAQGDRAEAPGDFDIYASGRPRDCRAADVPATHWLS